MLHVKIKSKDTNISFPVPYAMLDAAIAIVGSTFFQQKLDKWTKNYFERNKIDMALPNIDNQMLKPVIKELKKHKGLVLVDIKAKDGTEVRIKI